MSASHPSPPASPKAKVIIPEVEIVLSRPAYRLGGTVVGTIRVLLSGTTNDNDAGAATAFSATTTAPPPHCLPREAIHSLDLVLLGRCRLDPRWHNFTYYRNLYSNNNNKKDDVPCHLVNTNLLPPSLMNTVCFWATNPVDLLSLRERQAGRWEDAKPKPVRLPGTRTTKQQQSASSSSSLSSSLESSYSSSSSHPQGNDETVSSCCCLEDQQLAFSFRANLDSDLPHSMAATSCRYYYSVGVRLKKSPQDKPRWTFHPLTVLTADPSDSTTQNATTTNSSSRTGMPSLQIRTGRCSAVAHSSGLPCALTAVQLHRPGGQLSVPRHGAAHYGSRQHLLQTMRVADPHGTPVCVLTVIGGGCGRGGGGGGVTLHPGSRLILKFDFPNKSKKAQPVEEDQSWVPCYQIAACLEGEEVVLRPPADSSGGGGSMTTTTTTTRARYHVFDTAHEALDPDCTERACLHLLLPLDAPCSIRTNIVAITVRCLVDVSVSKNRNGSSGNGGYQNLRLEVPCQVTHSMESYEEKDEDDDMMRQVPSIEELLGCGGDYDDDDDDDAAMDNTSSSIRAKRRDPKDPASFHTKDIGEDLKILSLHMADKCGLQPRPRPRA